MHSVIDLDAEENAAAVAAVNSSILFGAMKDILRTQGVEALEAMIAENMEVLEAEIQ